jgi:hypothetical protein
MLLFALFLPLTALADDAKKLPYLYGFENNSLTAEGWTTVDCINNSKILDVYPNSGSYHFVFDKTSSAQYLISPEIDSGGLDYFMTYYCNCWNANSFQFQVGYSTTTNALSAFTWEDVSSKEPNWTQYKAEIPSNAKYVAIKNSANQIILLDDFFFAVSGCIPPESLTVDDITDQTVTLTWTAPSTTLTVIGYAYQIAQHSDSWGTDTEVMDPALTSVTFDNLQPNTSYDFRIKTLYKEAESFDYTSITFLTDCSGSVSLPLYEDFENGLGCWRVVNGHVRTGIDAPYEQSNAFSFIGNAPQYLISPRLDCPADIMVSLKYCVSDTSMPKSFQVGYSTTTNDISAFNWDTEVTGTVWDYKEYKKLFPAGTTYIAVKYTSNSTGYLYIDDLGIYIDGVLPPAQMSASTITAKNVSLTWDAAEGATGYAYQYKKVDESTWSDEITTTATSAAINGLKSDTDYEARVRSICGNNASIYTTTRFTTHTALPYEMGFESGYGRWKMVDCNFNEYDILNDILGTGRRTQAAHESSVGFQFSLKGTTPQYLISPRFDDDKAITLSFYYRIPTNISETIYVGYSTTTDDKDAFTFGDAITVSSSNWTKYENKFPAGARFFAIKYTSNIYMMYIDDISFEEYSAYAKPTTLGYNTVSETEATMVWNVPNGATGFVYQYKKASDAEWSAEATLNTNLVVLSGLTPNTHYIFRVKTLYGNNASTYATYSFQTDANMVNLPYTDSFENGMGGWRMIDCDGTTNILKTSGSHSGSYCFSFFDSDQNQLLLSPHFAGGAPMKVSFYCQNYENYPGTFTVGYTSSKNDNIIWPNYSLSATSGKWTLYEAIIPAEAQYVVINCCEDGSILYLDDFCISYVPATITFSEEGYSTYYNSKQDAVLPAGMKAYIVTASENGTTLTYQTIADGDTWNNRTVPAGTAVMLQTAASTTTQNISVPLASPTAAAITQTNLLQGSDVAKTTTGEGKHYKLSYGASNGANANTLGWYWGATDGAAFTSGAHKAWLALPTSYATRQFIGLPDADSETGLNEELRVKSEECNAVYDLSGRKINSQFSILNSQLPKGIYIKNGRKEVIK